MSPKTPPQKLLFLCSFLLFSFLLPCSCELHENVANSTLKHHHKDGNSTAKDGKIKGMFVFGSSLVDTGNNNFLQTRVRADYLPYGIDFPGGPSGRFCNGKTVIDLIGDHLKLPPIPAFSNPSTKGNAILHGVDFASGGCGILDDTGSVAGKVTTLNQQIQNFEKVTLPALEAQLGLKNAESLSNYLFVVGVGGNDITFNYFLNAMKLHVTPNAFAEKIATLLSGQIQKLYSLGGRKFVLMSVNPLGSTPMAMELQNKVYTKLLNKASALFNAQLKTLIDEAKPKMPGSEFALVNTSKIIKGIIKNPAAKGFNDTSSPCCELESKVMGAILCKKGGNPCANRSNHVFFDALHPTEAVNAIIAARAYDSKNSADVYPTNIKQLAAL